MSALIDVDRAELIRLIDDHVGADGHLHPTIEVDGRESVDYTRLPVSRAALASVAVWISIAGADSTHSSDDRLVAGTRAAEMIAREVPGTVRVNFTMRDGTTGRRLSFDVVRDEP